MAQPFYPQPTPELSERRKALAPDIHSAFEALSFADGALPQKTKQLIAV